MGCMHALSYYYADPSVSRPYEYAQGAKDTVKQTTWTYSVLDKVSCLFASVSGVVFSGDVSVES